MASEKLKISPFSQSSWPWSKGRSWQNESGGGILKLERACSTNLIQTLSCRSLDKASYKVQKVLTSAGKSVIIIGGAFLVFLFFNYVWAPSVCHLKIRLCVLQRVGVGSWLPPQVLFWLPLQKALWKTATIYQGLSSYSKTWGWRFWAVGYVFADSFIGFFAWFLWIGSHSICLRVLWLSSILSKNLYFIDTHFPH